MTEFQDLRDQLRQFTTQSPDSIVPMIQFELRIHIASLIGYAQLIKKKHSIQQAATTISDFANALFTIGQELRYALDMKSSNKEHQTVYTKHEEVSAYFRRAMPLIQETNKLRLKLSEASEDIDIYMKGEMDELSRTLERHIKYIITTVEALSGEGNLSENW